MARTVNMDNLLAKIAALPGVESSAEELKEASQKGNLYSYEEKVFESQSVINFYRTRIQAKPPTKKPNESEIAFAKRQKEFEKAYNEWRFRICEGCGLEFCYAYTYEGVKFCSLDCLDSELRKIGLQVTRGRDLRLRWGLHHPAVVPSSALEKLRLLSDSSSGSDDVGNP